MTTKKYVPYGINGKYFVYDNEAGNIPMGYGKGDKKRAIQAICDKLNAKETDFEDKAEERHRHRNKSPFDLM